MVVLAERPALARCSTWPAPAFRHRDATVETAGLSQVTRDLGGNSNARTQQDSVEGRREQPCPGRVLLLALAMAPGQQQPRREGSREGVPAEAARGSPKGNPRCYSMGQLGIWLLNPPACWGCSPSSRGDVHRWELRELTSHCFLHGVYLNRQPGPICT